MTKTKKDFTYEYLLLSRLKFDCKRYLDYGTKDSRHLWADDEEEHIKKMFDVYALLPEDKKPYGITLEGIKNFQIQMCPNSIITK